ncbi:MAG: esterase-like activity of phytase family protein [Pseudonocardiaceae bacterium]
MIPTRRRAVIAALCAVAVTVGLTGTAQAGPAAGSGVPERGKRFDRVATLPVFRNSSPDQQTAAEIAAATKDGRLIVYTDSPAERIGFVDLADVAAPRPDGVLPMPGEPTSVKIVGDLALVAVNTSTSFTAPSGRLVVVDVRTRAIVAEHDLGGQPDSVDISVDGRYAAVAIENERDEDVNDGAIPQPPAGFLSIVDLTGAPTDWLLRRVELTGLADVVPEDPEPEFVSINSRNQVVVTLQENNHVVVVDLANGSVVTDFSAGTGTASGVDTVEDGTIRLDGTVTVPREPDGVSWLDDRFIATADEGDLVGGSRTWTVFDTRDGSVVFSSGAELDQLAARYGQYPEGRAADKGVEPEGIAVATYGRQRYAFVALERANLVAVYRVNDPRRPELVQAVPTGVGPEGVLALPQRGALVVAAEEDSAGDNVRSSISTYRMTSTPLVLALERNAAAPSIVSAGSPPIGFGALSGLDAAPGVSGLVGGLVAVEDNAYTPTRVLSIDSLRRPALLTGALTVRKDSAPVGYDAEGIATRPGGGYWIAAEGDGEAIPNLLVEVDASGSVVRGVPLPADIAHVATSNGFEGVTTIGRGANEQVWVAVQRTWADDQPGQVKLARFTPATGRWDFVAYPLDPAPAGATVGLSEVTAVDDDTLLLIERDNRRGDDAQIKKVTRVELAGVTPVPAGLSRPVLVKQTALDLIPALSAGGGVVADKPEGLAITGLGALVGAVDNDGLDDAPGESVLLRLGRAPRR